MGHVSKFDGSFPPTGCFVTHLPGVAFLWGASQEVLYPGGEASCPKRKVSTRVFFVTICPYYFGYGFGARHGAGLGNPLERAAGGYDSRHKASVLQDQAPKDPRSAGQEYGRLSDGQVTPPFELRTASWIRSLLHQLDAPRVSWVCWGRGGISRKPFPSSEQAGEGLSKTCKASSTS